MILKLFQKDPQMKKYETEKIYIDTEGGKMKLLILRPTNTQKSAAETPGILWIHGGGYAVGMASMVFMSRVKSLVKNHGAVVVAPEYRLSGKAPFPAALHDCYAALRYIHNHADELGCSKYRIMVGGESAGGGLTAALCMYARDIGEVPVVFQMPLYPMLDDRDTDSSRKNNSYTWNTKLNHAAWKKYLSAIDGDIPVYAVPARQTDYNGLPPAYTFVGSREAFYCETLSYIENLKNAGVPAKVDVYPIGFHSFDMLLPFLKISRKAKIRFEEQYLYAAEHYISCKENKYEK